MARWEPGHGGFKWRHPWKQYLKVGSLSRECAYKLDALNAYLDQNKQVQITGTNLATRSKIEEQCTIISSETGKAIKELASTMKRMKRCTTTVDAHLSKAKKAAEILKSQLNNRLLLEESGGSSVLEIIAIGSVCSILIDIIECVENITKSVEQLGIEADFHQLTPAAVQPISVDIIITIDIASLDHNNANSSASE